MTSWRGLLRHRAARSDIMEGTITATRKLKDRPGAKLGSGEAWLPRLWAGGLVAFLIAGLTGSLMRYWIIAGFPEGVQFANVRHAHSHLMFFSWVTPALMALIAARLPALRSEAGLRSAAAQTGRPAPPLRLSAMVWAAGAALLIGLLSYPPFFLWGYEPAAVAGRRLPISVIFSTLHLFTWYAFALAYRQARRGVPRTRPVKLWDAALAFLLAASLGAWGRAILAALKIDSPFLSAAAVHLFLDLFSNGWAVLGLLGLIYAAKPKLAQSVSGWEDPLLFLGLPLTFLLGIPVDLVPTDLRTLAGAGGLMAAAGLALHVKALWPHFEGSFWSGWRAPLAFLGLKAGLDAAASLAPLARWGEGIGLRILYLHVLLLGFVSLGLVTAGLKLWFGQARGLLPWMGAAVCALLFSLVTLSGLWPAPLAGDWRLGGAFLLSLGPVLVAALLVAFSARRVSRTEPGATGDAWLA